MPETIEVKAPATAEFVITKMDAVTAKGILSSIDPNNFKYTPGIIVDEFSIKGLYDKGRMAEVASAVHGFTGQIKEGVGEGELIYKGAAAQIVAVAIYAIEEKGLNFPGSGHFGEGKLRPMGK